MSMYSKCDQLQGSQTDKHNFPFIDIEEGLQMEWVNIFMGFLWSSYHNSHSLHQLVPLIQGPIQRSITGYTAYSETGYIIKCRLDADHSSLSHSTKLHN